MIGSQSVTGLCSRAIDVAFAIAAEDSYVFSSDITMSVISVDKDAMIDLLPQDMLPEDDSEVNNGAIQQGKPTVRVHSAGSFLENVSLWSLSCAEDCLMLLSRANRSKLSCSSRQTIVVAIKVRESM